jgi:hypothetical protein
MSLKFQVGVTDKRIRCNANRLTESDDWDESICVQLQYLGQRHLIDERRDEA